MVQAQEHSVDDAFPYAYLSWEMDESQILIWLLQIQPATARDPFTQETCIKHSMHFYSETMIVHGLPSRSEAVQ